MENEQKTTLHRERRHHKVDHIKATLANYLHRRKYNNTFESRASDSDYQSGATAPQLHHTYTEMQGAISCANSILYTCTNHDAHAIDQSFARFLAWQRTRCRRTSSPPHELEQLTAPLFLHLYLDIERATGDGVCGAFFRTYATRIAANIRQQNSYTDDRCQRGRTDNFDVDINYDDSDLTMNNNYDTDNCDGVEVLRSDVSIVSELFEQIQNKYAVRIGGVEEGVRGNDDLKRLFRSNRYTVWLTPESLAALRSFVAEHCHVVVLHALHARFDLREKRMDEEEFDEEEEEGMEEGAEINENFVPHDSLNSDNDQLKTEIGDRIRGGGGVEGGGGEDDGSSNIEANTEGGRIRDFLDLCDELENGYGGGGGGGSYGVGKKSLFVLGISRAKETVDCALLRRDLGIVAFSQQNGLHIQSICTLKNVFDHPTVREITQYDHSGRIHSISMSDDGVYLATASADHTIILYHLSALQLHAKCVGHFGAVYATAFNANGNLIASASADQTVRLWSTEDGGLVRILAGHTQAVLSVDFHPNCLYVATGGADQQVRLWSVDSGEPLRLFVSPQGISAGGGLVGSGVGGGMVYSVAFSPLGSVLASGEEGGRIRVWDLLSGALRMELGNGAEGVAEEVVDGASEERSSNSQSSPICRLKWSVSGGGSSGDENSGSGEWLCSSQSGKDCAVKLWCLNNGGGDGDMEDDGDDGDEIIKISEPTLCVDVGIEGGGTKVVALDLCMDTFGCVVAP